MDLAVHQMDCGLISYSHLSQIAFPSSTTLSIIMFYEFQNVLIFKVYCVPNVGGFHCISVSWLVFLSVGLIFIFLSHGCAVDI